MNHTPLEDQVHDALHRRVDPLQRSPFTWATSAPALVASGAAAPWRPEPRSPPCWPSPSRSASPRSGRPSAATYLPATQPPAPSITGTVLIDPRSAPVVDDLSVPMIDVVASTLLTDGETIALPKTYDTITPYQDGWVAEAINEGALTIEFLTSDLEVEDQGGPSGGLVVSPDGQRIAWTEYTGSRWQVVTSDVAGAEEWVYTKFPPGPEECHGAPGRLRLDDRGDRLPERCRRRRDDVRGRRHRAGRGPGPRRAPGARRRSPAWSPDSPAPRPRARARRWSTARRDTGALAWETCDYQLGAFSPDGALVVGFAAQSDGYGSRTVSILDATTGRDSGRLRGGRQAPTGRRGE